MVRTTTQGKHSVFTTLSTDYDASFVYYQCTFTSTRGGWWILPGGGARIIRHSLLGQIDVRNSVSCSAYALRIERLHYLYAGGSLPDQHVCWWRHVHAVAAPPSFPDCAGIQFVIPQASCLLIYDHSDKKRWKFLLWARHAYVATTCTKLRVICYTSYRVRVVTIEIRFTKNWRTYESWGIKTTSEAIS